MIANADVQTVRQIIDRYEQFILTTHVNPDGDGLGPETAMAEYLFQRKKRVNIINLSPVPANYRFLDPNGRMELFSQDRHIEALTSADAIFILDISDWGRLRELGKLVRSLRMEKVCIDHHPVQAPFADHDLIYPRASSTGEVIFELLKKLDAKFNKRINEAIYTAILTDTGSFRFTNTTPNAHKVAAALLQDGIEPRKIYSEVYENQSLPRIRLMAQALERLQLEFNGRLAWLVITQEMLHATGTTMQDTEGLADFPRTITGVEISLLFLELEDDQVKISFRSKGNIVINRLAQALNGGGHAFAAGATVKGPLNRAVKDVLARAGELFRQKF